MKKIFLIISALVFFIVSNFGNLALAYNDFYSQNDILFYDENASDCSSFDGTIDQLYGNNNKEKIYNYWLARGLTPAQSAGITANMFHEGGFSPFRHEDSWGANFNEGGYGIAQFTGAQRTRAVDHLTNDLGETFTNYYKDDYGGIVYESNGYVFENEDITVEINDKFLLSQLNLLYTIASESEPAWEYNYIRSNELKEAYPSLIIGDDQKLLDYLKSLDSTRDVAVAWTYLYEWPTNRLWTSKARADTAEEYLKVLGSGSSTGSSAGPDICNFNVGVGGLTFSQARNFIDNYYVDRFDYFDSWWSGYDQSNQCTALVYYFNNRFVADYFSEIRGQGDGNNVTKYLISDYSNYFDMNTTENLKPFSIFSLDHGKYGHTGVILGIASDKSVVVGESNINEIPHTSSGLLEYYYTGDKANDKYNGSVSVTRWESIEKWENYWANINYDIRPYASPTDLSSVTKKVQDSLNGQ